MANADLPSLNIIEVCEVGPPLEGESPAPRDPVPLTFFDILWLRFHPVQRLFFYQTPPSADTASILQNLKSSLSLTLRHYLPLAGHITWPPHSPVPVIEFSPDDAVSLTVAESHTDFHRLSSNGLRKAEEYHPLVPGLRVSHQRAAVVALQITLFPKAGFSLGVTTHHAILDGTSSTSFLKSWARICRTNSTGPTDGPFYDRSVIKDPAGLTNIYAGAWLDMGGPKNRSLSLLPPKTPPGLTRCTLELTRPDLEKLKQWVAKKTQQPGVRVSSFVATTAYLSVCTAKMKGSSADKIGIIFAMDARARLEPPVPPNYFGNCLVWRPKFLERCELSGENGMVCAVEAILEVIKSVEEEGALKGAENLGMVIESTVSDDETRLVCIGGSPRFGVYSTDFGWGKPRKVEMVSIEITGAFSLAETGSGDGGIEIGFVGETNEVESFVALFVEGLTSI